MNFPNSFAKFYDKIILGDKQVERIESAVGSLRTVLGSAFDVDEDDREDWLFEQGSYANQTAVKPADEDGEYDIDLVAMSAEPGDSPNDALDAVAEVLEANGNYEDKVERCDPCVRLRYADDDIGGFHVDVVPARESDGEAPIEVPRRNEDWHGSDPKKFTEWAGGQGDYFKTTVQMLKRWRDHNGDARTNIKSIILQVLISEHLADYSADALRIEGTLQNIKTELDQHTETPEILNPVLKSENLAAKWSHAEFYEFKLALDKAVEVANEAITTSDPARAHDLWQELFGDDFPKYDPGSENKALPKNPTTGVSRESFGRERTG